MLSGRLVGLRSAADPEHVPRRGAVGPAEPAAVRAEITARDRSPWSRRREPAAGGGGVARLGQHAALRAADGRPLGQREDQPPGGRPGAVHQRRGRRPQGTSTGRRSRRSPRTRRSSSSGVRSGEYGCEDSAAREASGGDRAQARRAAPVATTPVCGSRDAERWEELGGAPVIGRVAKYVRDVELAFHPASGPGRGGESGGVGGADASGQPVGLCEAGSGVVELRSPGDPANVRAEVAAATGLTIDPPSRRRSTAVDLYAKVFVRWDWDADSLVRAVAPLVDGEVVRRTVTGPVLDLDLEENEVHDEDATGPGVTGRREPALAPPGGTRAALVRCGEPGSAAAAARPRVLGPVHPPLLELPARQRRARRGLAACRAR